MGKPGKKAGKGLLPPTNVKRKIDPTKSHLRDQRTIKRLKMYDSKIKRNEKGDIVKGSVLQASDRITQSMARIAPDRRWFGNTRVIGQEALQQFRSEMGAKYRDPYSVIIKQGKLPLSLLEEPKTNPSELLNGKQEMRWDATFGDKARRKRVNLQAATGQAGGGATLEHFLAHASDRTETYQKDGGKREKDRSLVKPIAESRADKSQNRVLFKKGQSSRIWNELYKVVDSADVILYVLDARDPMGTRSPFLEDYLRREKKYKHFVLVLNKCDLIPLWATSRWLQILSKDFPTIAFHASVNHPFGKGNLISLLRQFSKLHNVTHRGSSKTKTPISVGIVGYPNVGKSSVINTLRRKTVCKVAPIPGETKVWQYVALTRSIFMIDCPGIVYDREGNNDVQAVLKGVVRVERLGSADKTDVVDTVLQIVKHKDIVATYGVPEWRDVNHFLEQVAKLRGKLLPGGEADVDLAARTVLYDWQRGKLPWFNAPPFESNQKFRDAVEMGEEKLMKVIEHYNTFQIIDDRLEKPNPDAAAAAAGEEEEEDDDDDSLASDEEEEDEDNEDEAALDAKVAAEEAKLLALSKKQQKSQPPQQQQQQQGSKKRGRGEDNNNNNNKRPSSSSSAMMMTEDPDSITVATFQAKKEEDDRKAQRLAKRQSNSKKHQEALRGEQEAHLLRQEKDEADDDALWGQFVAAAATTTTTSKRK